MFYLKDVQQVNHFGSFVRHFFSLTVPTDIISARMVLTTFDSAVYHATSSPCVPVHINCPFREPLESTPKEWRQSCLKGLEIFITPKECNFFTRKCLILELKCGYWRVRGALLALDIMSNFPGFRLILRFLHNVAQACLIY
uniref:protein PHYLLO, chloroplastic-like n=1 Tax=Erigeron canadensis TaxID=72917 RepID=UPI001CB90752|nr:protein PHYLLO, chloroplastic-like [Erigeron canadensis]